VQYIFFSYLEGDDENDEEKARECSSSPFYLFPTNTILPGYGK